MRVYADTSFLVRLVREEPGTDAAGVACDQLWVVAAAIDHAPSLQRANMADGLHAAKSVDLSYPRGPADFTVPKATTGGQFWRPLQFFTACNCWKVIDPTFHPSV